MNRLLVFIVELDVINHHTKLTLDPFRVLFHFANECGAITERFNSPVFIKIGQVRKAFNQLSFVKAIRKVVINPVLACHLSDIWTKNHFVKDIDIGSQQVGF
ncbi:hypothetical protein D3C84_1047950 [compost metagenome]